MVSSGLYRGILRHRRFSPQVHEFTYPLFMAFLEVDRLRELTQVSPWVSYNRFNWASYDDRDHLGDPRLPLRERLRQEAQLRGIEIGSGKIFLLTHLRYLGYCFNPVSYFYFYNEADELIDILAEVNNTPWGERHLYWMSQNPVHFEEGRRTYQVPKAFHVSPFIPMECRYEWSFGNPDSRLGIRIREFQEDTFFFDVDLHLVHHPWNPETIRQTLFAFPWMTFKVIISIHWQALRLWCKRVPVQTHPKKIKPPQ
ncbi:MAG: DUF1365 domain-containing protein [Holophagaceae bacterium]